MPVCSAGARYTDVFSLPLSEKRGLNDDTVMEEKDTKLLDDFFNGLLSASEAEAFRARTVAEPELGRAFALRARMEQWVAREPGRNALSENLVDIGVDFFRDDSAQAPLKAGRVNPLRRWLLAAASVALFAFAVWFVQRGRPSSLYDQYAQLEPLALTERGTATDSLASAAESAFNQKRYPEALNALEGLLAQHPDNAAAELYRGICLLQLKRPVDARRALEPLAAGPSALRADAIWQIALSFLSENNTADCAVWLRRLNTGDAHYKKAQELLGKIS
jgi:tetratricopeptide (TPR) repeat protein